MCFLLVPDLTFASPNFDSLIREAMRIRWQYPDSAIQLLHTYHLDFLERQDTLYAIKALTHLATVHGNRANYRDSYEQLWKALSLADQANLEQQIAYIYRRIGKYYGFYKRREKALDFFQKSLALYKSLVKRGVIDEAMLTHPYTSFTTTFREFGEPELAQIYMDSCFLYVGKGEGGKRRSYLNIEQGFILAESKQHQQAIQLLEASLPWVEERLPSYKVLVYSYLGDAYRGIGQVAISEQYYKDALNISETYNSHIDFSILVHEKLANLYAAQGDFPQAHEERKKAKELNELFFDSRSENNRALLEIQDEFRKELENKEKYLQEQRMAQLEHESEVNFLQATIVTGLLVFLLLFGLLYVSYLRNKFQGERRLAEKKRALEIQKNTELLEIKNKELATSTLKLIEKDKFLQELQNKLTVSSDKTALSEVKRIIKQTTHNNSNNWTEFEARFIDVNKDFYKNLRSKYPKLTIGDRKLCALIKLNFTSKEIARLMGISVESVHTTRYRLRKKLKIEKGVDLTDFMSQF